MMLLMPKTASAWLSLATAVLLPAATLASTVTIASPISTDVNPPIDLTVYGNNTSAFLNGTYTVYWNAHLNVTPPYLEIAVDVKTSGWFGFGFADPASGGMKGSDIATITVIPNATHYVTSITDRYAVAHALPSEDDVNNFNLNAGWQAPDKSHTIVVFTRPLNTSDSQDRVIGGGSVSVVMAYNSDGSTNVAYHGPNKQAYTIEFFKDPSIPPPSTGEVIMTWNYTNPATPITTAETRYVCTSFIFEPKLANGSDASGQIVRISPVIDPNTVAWVHHYVVYGCANTTKFNQYLGKPTECLTNDNGLGDSCPQVVFAWAVGSGSLDFPLDVGASFGDPTDPETIKFLAIQVHYNNPSLQAVNITDQSGLSFDYITTQRKYNSGSIQLGDPTIAANPIPFGPGNSNFAYEFTCPSECTSLWPGDITIFTSMLHAHSYGTQLVSTVTSNGVTTDLNRADYYEYAFQHIAAVNHTIKKGDKINVHCVFDASQNIFGNDPLHANDTAVRFGLSSENEMCLDYVFYYPRFPRASQYGFCGNGGSDTTLCGYNDKGVIRLEIANPVQPNSSYADPNWILTKRFGLNKTGVAALDATMAANPGPTNSTSSTTPTSTTTTSSASSNFRAGTVLVAMVGWALVAGLM